MCDYNVWTFMGDHWLITLILAWFALQVCLAPFRLLAWRWKQNQ